MAEAFVDRFGRWVRKPLKHAWLRRAEDRVLTAVGAPKAPPKKSMFCGSMGVLNSFDIGTGNREDLLDIVTNISPMDVAYAKSVGTDEFKERKDYAYGGDYTTVPTARSHEWVMDKVYRQDIRETIGRPRG